MPIQNIHGDLAQRSLFSLDQFERLARLELNRLNDLLFGSVPFDRPMGGRFSVGSFVQLRFLYPGDEFISTDDTLTYYLIADALALDHFLDQGFPVRLSGFLRISAIIS